MTRGAWPSVETSPSSSGHDVLTGDEQLDRLDAGAGGASTRSSLSTAKRPVSSRCLRAERSFRTSRSFSFWTRLDQASSGGFGVERGLGALGDGGERLRVAHGDVGERLAVELDPGLLARPP